MEAECINEAQFKYGMSIGIWINSKITPGKIIWYNSFDKKYCIKTGPDKFESVVKDYLITDLPPALRAKADLITVVVPDNHLDEYWATYGVLSDLKIFGTKLNQNRLRQLTTAAMGLILRQMNQESHKTKLDVRHDK